MLSNAVSPMLSAFGIGLIFQCHRHVGCRDQYKISKALLPWNKIIQSQIHVHYISISFSFIFIYFYIFSENEYIQPIQKTVLMRNTRRRRHIIRYSNLMDIGQQITGWSIINKLIMLEMSLQSVIGKRLSISHKISTSFGLIATQFIHWMRG